MFAAAGLRIEYVTIYTANTTDKQTTPVLIQYAHYLRTESK